MTPTRLVAAFIAVFVVQSFAKGDTPIRKPLEAAVATKVDEAVAEQMKEQQLVGVAIGVIQDGEIVYLKGYGEANREKKLPMTTRTVVNWASNSKPLAAVLAMQLVQQGKLDLDADIRNYVPEFPEKEHVITMRKLLCHQSGIPHYTNGKVVPTQRELPSPTAMTDPVLALDKFNQSPLMYKPGEKSTYTTHGYVLVSAATQKAGGQPIEKQLDDRIIKPLGLLSLQLDLPTKDQPNWAVGYGKSGEKIVVAREEANYWKHGGGGYKSNIEDFTKWAQALVNRRLVNEATETAMWTRQSLADGKKTGMGLGFAVSETPELKVSHGGAQGEAKSTMDLYPRSKRGVVVLSNCSHANPAVIANAVKKALTADK